MWLFHLLRGTMQFFCYGRSHIEQRSLFPVICSTDPDIDTIGCEPSAVLCNAKLSVYIWVTIDSYAIYRYCFKCATWHITRWKCVCELCVGCDFEDCHLETYAGTFRRDWIRHSIVCLKNAKEVKYERKLQSIQEWPIRIWTR